MHSCKHSEHNMVCERFEDEDEFEWMLRGVTNLDTRSLKKKKNAIETLKPLNDLFQGPGEPAHKINKVRTTSFNNRYLKTGDHTNMTI